MKKLLCVFSLLLLVGCAQSTNIKPVTRSLSFIGEMTYYNEYYEINADIDKQGKMTVKFTHPEELKDLTFTMIDDTVTCEFQGITYQYDDEHKSAALSFVYNAFCEENPQVYEKDNQFFTKGNFNDNEYKMFIGQTGLPLKIVDSAARFEILIKNATIIQ